MQNAVQSRDCAAVAMDFLLGVLEIQILLFLALALLSRPFHFKDFFTKKGTKGRFRWEM